MVSASTDKKIHSPMFQNALLGSQIVFRTVVAMTAIRVIAAFLTLILQSDGIFETLLLVVCLKF